VAYPCEFPHFCLPSRVTRYLSRGRACQKRRASTVAVAVPTLSRAFRFSVQRTS
jgi:hypothetical protein